MFIDPKAQMLLENGKKNPIYLLPIQEARAAMVAFQTQNRKLEEMRGVEDYSVPSLPDRERSLQHRGSQLRDLGLEQLPWPHF